jgi:hypothetical protein
MFAEAEARVFEREGSGQTFPIGKKLRGCNYFDVKGQRSYWPDDGVPCTVDDGSVGEGAVDSETEIAKNGAYDVGYVHEEVVGKEMKIFILVCCIG